MKEYFHFAWKVLIALLIIFAVADLIARFAGINVKTWITSPLATVLPASSSGS